MSELDAKDAKTVLDEARGEANLEDLGQHWFEDGLEALLSTYQRNAFNEKRQRRNRNRMIGAAGTRLRAQAALTAHPEIEQREIRRPMFLTGLPRSGTSALFNLLAADSAARPLLLWESQFPEPLEGHDPATPDPRHEAIRAYYEKGRETNPEWNKIHQTHADTPEECVLLHLFAFHGVQYGIEIFLEPYASWYQENLHRLDAVYAHQKQYMQMLDWQRPGERWLLKAPAHMWGLDALLETFPDAAIVWSHRDPRLCVASICSMTATLMRQVDGVDPTELGPRVMEFYARSLERGLAVRDGLGADRVVDVTHDEFVSDPLGAATRIYQCFGLDAAPIASELASHVGANPKDKHGSHDYGLEDYGLSEDRVLDRFEAYVSRFDVTT
jgi:hypothetical protein